MTALKKDGGLGFQDIRAFNEAMLAKISWRILQNPQSLLSKILLGKYCHEESILQVTCVKSCSHGWRSILIGRDILVKQLGWIPLNEQTQPMGPGPLTSRNWRVRDLFISNSLVWDEGKINRTFPVLADHILSIKPSQLQGKDRQVWLLNPDGYYSTKSSYHVARQAPKDLSLHPQGPVNWFSVIWSVKTSPKVKFFLWKAFNEACQQENSLCLGKSLLNLPAVNAESLNLLTISFLLGPSPREYGNWHLSIVLNCLHSLMLRKVWIGGKRRFVFLPQD